MSKQTVLVTGATGSQGGSVVEYLLQDGGYNIVALTRDPSKEAAKKLESKGVKIVKGDLADKDSLKEAFKGVDALFLVTQFWEKFSQDQEFTEGKNAIDAAKNADVKHIVFSSLENVKKITGYAVPHFDGKGKIAEYAKEQKVPLTEVQVAYYAQNFFGFFPIKKDDNGNLFFSFGLKDNVKMDVVDVSQLGGIVLAILKNPTEWIGKTLGVSGGLYSGQDLAAALSKATGKKISFVSLPYEVQKKYSEDIANMFRFYEDFEGKLRHPEESKKLYPKLRSFEEFIQANETWAKSL